MVGTLQDQQLVPQDKNLGLQGSAIPEEAWHREKQGQEQGEHCLGSRRFTALQTQLFQRERTFW